MPVSLTQPQLEIISYLLEWLPLRREEVSSVGKMWSKGKPCILLMGM